MFKVDASPQSGGPESAGGIQPGDEFRFGRCPFHPTRERRQQLGIHLPGFPRGAAWAVEMFDK